MGFATGAGTGAAGVAAETVEVLVAVALTELTAGVVVVLTGADAVVAVLAATVAVLEGAALGTIAADAAGLAADAAAAAAGAATVGVGAFTAVLVLAGTEGAAVVDPAPATFTPGVLAPAEAGAAAGAPGLATVVVPSLFRS